MTKPSTIRFYLEPPLRKSAEEGRHNFIGKMAGVLEKAGYQAVFETPGMLGALPNRGRSLSHMKPPPDHEGLVFRRAYHYPFWQIEQTEKRWSWDTALSSFDPEHSPRKEAEHFYAFWQKRLFVGAVEQSERAGFVYVPLQGRLLEHRSFQACSPIEMLHHCLVHEPNRQIIAALHPKENYTATEVDAIEALAAQHPRLEVIMGNMQALLKSCDYVVTQNSSAAFNGYFFGKPALLFAQVDFHHIAVAADLHNLSQSFAEMENHAPNYAAYIHWFWQDQCINAGREDAEEKIAARLKRFGWPVG
ncbi:hypothetical protein C1J03_00320 [Sulfitobacter sp. SK012]|uniref:capsular polysaccharide export protein, LipB/KpsS family n=1 Tax=Sulfitobacter sp. SK012 TaxID=1389005 RepID=UPI000E0C900D|nr:hypothetical protein [Sulfitobacter sp. SK012]AXI44607.1 hypothetical protein C1J03_00320 [Sulfitobacter sp. SK012]